MSIGAAQTVQFIQVGQASTAGQAASGRTTDGTAIEPGIRAITATSDEGGQRPPVWMAPRIGKTLVDRVDLTDRLAVMLVPGGSDIGVVGSGGFGKTTLVSQACHSRQVKDTFPGGLLWVTLGEQLPDPILAERINDLSEMLSGRRPALTGPAAAGYRLGELMAERGPMLLVIDDLWESDRLDPFPSGPGVTRVVTTRTKGSLPADVRRLQVDGMSSEEGSLVLAAGIPGLKLTERLTKRTGGWPLLMALANGAMRVELEFGATADQVADLVADRLAQDGPDSLDLDSAGGRALAVKATVEASLLRLGDRGRDRFLELGVFPEDVEIPAAVVHLLWAASGLDAPERRSLYRRLVDLSLIHASGDSFRLHDVLRAYVRQASAASALVEANSRLAVTLIREAQGDWDSAHPYTLRHLADHAAEAGQLDALLTDAKFLLAASQPELLASLGAARGAAARTAALVYQRTAHNLRDRDANDRSAYLSLAAYRAGAQDLAEVADEQSEQSSPWRCVWAQSHHEPDHRVIARHWEAVVHVAIAPLRDGRVWIVTVGVFGDVHVVDLASNENVVPPWLASIPDVSVIACVPMQDGRHVVIVDSLDSGQHMWDLESGENTEWQIPDTGKHCKEIVLTEYRGRPVVVIQYWDYTIRAWDPATGRGVGETVPFECQAETRFCTIATGILPNGHLGVAVANEEAPVQLWDLETGKREATLASPHPRTMTVAWGRHGLFTAGDAPDIQRWDIKTGKPLKDGLNGHVDDIDELRYVSVPGYGDLVISGDDSGTIRLWNAESGASVGGPVAAHAGSIRSLACTRLNDGRVVVASGGNEHTARLWDLQVFMSQTPQPVAMAPVTSVAHSGKHMVSGHDDGTVRVWDDRRIVHELTTPSPVETLACHGLYAVSGHDDDEITPVWDVIEGRQVGHLGHKRSRPTWSISISALDGEPVAVTGREGTVLDAWRLQSGDRLWRTRLPLTTKWENTGRFGLSQYCSALDSTTLPDGRQVVVAGAADGTIRVLDLRTGDHIGDGMNARSSDQPSPAAVSALACTRLPDGRVVAVAGSENMAGTVAVWDLVTHSLVAKTQTVTDWVHHALCTTLPDGSQVAITGDTLLRIWPLDALSPDVEWEPVLEIDLDAPVTALDVAPDGTVVAGTKHGLAHLVLQFEL